MSEWSSRWWRASNMKSTYHQQKEKGHGLETYCLHQGVYRAATETKQISHHFVSTDIYKSKAYRLVHHSKEFTSGLAIHYSSKKDQWNDFYSAKQFHRSITSSNYLAYQVSRLNRLPVRTHTKNEGTQEANESKSGFKSRYSRWVGVGLTRWFQANLSLFASRHQTVTWCCCLGQNSCKWILTLCWSRSKCAEENHLDIFQMQPTRRQSRTQISRTATRMEYLGHTSVQHYWHNTTSLIQAVAKKIIKTVHICTIKYLYNSSIEIVDSQIQIMTLGSVS